MYEPSNPVSWIIVAFLVLAAVSILIAVNELAKHSVRSRRSFVTNRPGRGLSVLPPTSYPSPEMIEEIMERIKSPQPPETAGNLEAQSIRNWKRIPAPLRKDCVTHLRNIIRSSSDGAVLIEKWSEQKAKGLRIGHDEFGFHFGTGMWVRNTLRQKLRDDKLPAVKYGSGESYQNWDDFYYGAIDELAGAKK